MKKILLTVFAILTLSLMACKNDGLVLSDTSEHIYPDEEKENNEKENASDASSFDAKTDEKYFVYICGAVENEGIYEFVPGTRLFELIERAGGLDEEADSSAINLSIEVSDEQFIRIPYIGEDIHSSEENLININKADVSELCTIPGIGEARANAIIEYREANGGFNDIEELKNIPGIKEATFSRIKAHVCIR